MVLIPGIISSGLEMWDGAPCARRTHFRRRLWGSNAMFGFALAPQCWLQHLKLNESTWDDPEGVKLRATQGLGSADFFVGGYNIWGRLIENFADVGYDESNLFLASFDWRLPFAKLEIRDGYFSALKSRIELMKKTSGGERVMVISHSMGTPLFLHFMQWVVAETGREAWVDDHIAIWSNVAGSLLGAPKSVTSVLSAEMRDSAEMGDTMNWLRSKIFSRKQMLGFLRSLGSLPSLFPRGGRAIWGDPSSENRGRILSFNEFHRKPLSESSDNHLQKTNQTCAQLHEDEIAQKYFGVEGAYGLLRRLAPKFMSLVDSSYSFGLTKSPPPAGAGDQKTWSNPLQSALPKAPRMQIACMYGVGKPSEVGYAYRIKPQKAGVNSSCLRAKVDMDVSKTGGDYVKGVKCTDGDGTIPLEGLGLMCSSAALWNGTTPYNPSGMKVVTKEYAHDPNRAMNVLDPWTVVQGGEYSAEHVAILGHRGLINDVMRMATASQMPTDRLYSNLPALQKVVEANLEEVFKS